MVAEITGRTIGVLSLTQADIDAIADAVLQKFEANGYLSKITEAWQRLGLDPGNPVVHHPDGSFDVGDIDVNASEAGGSITQTRQ